MRAHAERGGTATLHETQGIKREEDMVGIRGGRCTATQVEMVLPQGWRRRTHREFPGSETLAAFQPSRTLRPLRRLGGSSD